MTDCRFDSTRWEPLDPGPPRALIEARLLAHWAAQLVAAAGTTHAPARDDFSHTNLGWNRALGALVGRPIGARGMCAALRPSDLHLIVVEEADVLSEFDLDGATLQTALGWLGETLSEADGTLGGELALPEHELPRHAVGAGAPFPSADRAALAELARWFGNAHLVAAAVAADEEKASDPRCWPHHFDLATLITLDEERSIGVGMSPGGGSYDDPYFYVTPWPYPSKTDSLPQLPAGHWHTEGWVGAVLPAPGPDTLTEFLDASLAALRPGAR